MHVMIRMTFKPEDLCRFFREQGGKRDIDCRDVKKFLDVFYDVFIEELNPDIKLMCEDNETLRYFLVYGKDNSYIIVKIVYFKEFNEIDFVFTISTDCIWKVSSLINILGKYAKIIDVV